MRRTRVFLTLVLTVGAWLLVVPAANAYVDPASGSYIIQLLVGFAMAAALSVKVFWSRIKSLFSRSGGSDHEAGPEQT